MSCHMHTLLTLALWHRSCLGGGLADGGGGDGGGDGAEVEEEEEEEAEEEEAGEDEGLLGTPWREHTTFFLG